MARIYKRTDRIPIKIDDIVVKVAPLSFDQKTEIQQAMLSGRAKSDLKELSRGISLSMKYAIKAIDGLVDGDGNAYKLDFENEMLTDSCVDDLMNIELTKKLSLVCAALLSGIPKEFTDNEGKKLDGVEVIVNSAPKVESEKNA